VPLARLAGPITARGCAIAVGVADPDAGRLGALTGSSCNSAGSGHFWSGLDTSLLGSSRLGRSILAGLGTSGSAGGTAGGAGGTPDRRGDADAKACTSALEIFTAPLGSSIGGSSGRGSPLGSIIFTNARYGPLLTRYALHTSQRSNRHVAQRTQVSPL